MLNIAGRIALGVEIADLLLLHRSLRLELQRTLERDRVVDAPAQEDNVLCVGEQVRHLLAAVVTPIKYLQGSRS